MGQSASFSRFQSTHSLRSATVYMLIVLFLSIGFNPRTPCGVRQSSGVNGRESTMFQSTHSLRSATHQRGTTPGQQNVSIHALLAECDRRGHFVPRPVRSFNPRTPCGVRLASTRGRAMNMRFQSTHSLRSATNPGCRMTNCYLVSIHALLAECDPQQ